MAARTLLGLLLAATVTLAGCTGQFDIEQTEPLRIQVDGQDEETRLSADDDDGDGTTVREREFIVETDEDDETVVVVVQVKKIVVEDEDADMGEEPPEETGNESMRDSEPAIILVIIEDRDTGERLAEREVEATDEDEAEEVKLDVDVRGKNNVVIITQAIEGAADVNVAAESGEGGLGAGFQDEDDEETTTTTTNNTTRP